MHKNTYFHIQIMFLNGIQLVDFNQILPTLRLLRLPLSQFKAKVFSFFFPSFSFLTLFSSENTSATSNFSSFTSNHASTNVSPGIVLLFYIFIKLYFP